MTRIIDADGHIVEPRALWDDYAEPQFRDRMIQIRRNRDGGDELWINGENRSRPSLPVAASMTPGGLSDLERARKITWDDILPGGYDPYARIKVMDEEGINVAVLYPSLWLLYGDLTDPQLAAAACRAYNNWLADFCKPFPKRLFGVAPMPMQSVDEAVREMRRVVRELGFKAVFVRPNPFNGRRLNDAAYDPFWREAQELDIPVAVHGSFGTRCRRWAAIATTTRSSSTWSVIRSSTGGLHGYRMRRGARAISKTDGRLPRVGNRMARLLARSDG